MGLASCPSCGGQVGTLFSETAAAAVPRQSKYSRQISDQVSHYQAIDRARDQANNALVLSLASFLCPGIGFILSAAAIFLGSRAMNVLKSRGVEEGRGSAAAGIVIGIIAAVAQICYGIYLWKVGAPFLG